LKDCEQRHTDDFVKCAVPCEDVLISDLPVVNHYKIMKESGIGITLPILDTRFKIVLDKLIIQDKIPIK
jgi:hypothetical protein